MTDAKMLVRYAECHNRGVKTGNFNELLGLFHPDAELRFEGIAFGPFMGREEIDRAFRQHPPGDEIEIGEVAQGGSCVLTTYQWRQKPAQRAGTLAVEVKGNLIRKLVVTVL